jgi:hypothetical protein
MRQIQSLMRRLITSGLLLMLVFTLPGIGQAAPLAQDNPAEMCAEGVELASGGNVTEALPLLESGFASREEAVFDEPTILGACALVLGVLRENSGDSTGALESYHVALVGP